MLHLTPMNTLMREYAGNWFLILDGAVIKDVQRIVHEEDKHAESSLLYYGTEYERYCSISPCIIHVNMESKIIDRFRNEKIFSDAGSIFGFKNDLNSFKRMLVNIIEAKFSDGNIKLFRFYDPYVIKTLVQAHEGRLFNSILSDVDYIALLPDILCYNDEDRLISVYTMA